MATVTVEISEYDSLREQLKNEKEVNNSLKGEIVEYKKTIKEVETDKKESIQTISDNYNKEVKALESQARVINKVYKKTLVYDLNAAKLATKNVLLKEYELASEENLDPQSRLTLNELSSSIASRIGEIAVLQDGTKEACSIYFNNFEDVKAMVQNTMLTEEKAEIEQMRQSLKNSIKANEDKLSSLEETYLSAHKNDLSLKDQCIAVLKKEKEDADKASKEEIESLKKDNEKRIEVLGNTQKDVVKSFEKRIANLSSELKEAQRSAEEKENDIERKIKELNAERANLYASNKRKKIFGIF